MMIGRDGSSNKLLLDFDDVKSPSQIMARLPFVTRQLGLRVKSMSYVYSSSGRGIHVVILLGEMLPAPVIVSLQILCGSDWRRETFNLVRVKSLRNAPAFWRNRWNVLYAEKWRAGK